MNRILDDRAREEYAETIEEITHLVPEMDSRKIPRAKVQQAFVFHTLEQLMTGASRVFVGGSYEDTAAAALKEVGNFTLVEVDPVTNGLTAESYLQQNPAEAKQFDFVISTSVIEHVYNDEEYIRSLADLVTESGYLVVTFDWNPNWSPGKPLPSTCLRHYTPQDIARLTAILEERGLGIYGEVDYNGDLDFEWEGVQYAFGTLVAQRYE